MLLRLYKLFLLTRFKLIAFTWRNESKYAPNRKLCEEILLELSPKRFRQYRTSAALGTKVTVWYPNIELYSDKLKDTVRMIREEKPIPAGWVLGAPIDVSIDRFMVSQDGYYLDPEQAVAKFRTHGLELCAIMEEADHAEHGLPEHNLRMLTKLFINLRMVTRVLVETSLSY